MAAAVNVKRASLPDQAHHPAEKSDNHWYRAWQRNFQRVLRARISIVHLTNTKLMARALECAMEHVNTSSFKKRNSLS